MTPKQRGRPKAITDSARRAFTLVEVIVATLLIMIIATIALKSLGNYLDYQNAQSTADVLYALDSAFAGSKGIYTLDKNYTGRLSDLVNPINTTGTNSCGNTYAAKDSTNWITNGPFYSTYLSTSGTVTPIGTINDAITRSNGKFAGFLVFTIPSVNLPDAQNLDQIIDGGNGASAGAIQWTPAAATSGPVTVTYDAVAVGNRKC